jgi:hypothetical protein
MQSIVFNFPDPPYDYLGAAGNLFADQLVLHFLLATTGRNAVSELAVQHQQTPTEDLRAAFHLMAETLPQPTGFQALLTTAQGRHFLAY